MFKGLGDMANLMKSAKDIQEKIESFKASLKEIEVEGLGGGGMVRVKGLGDGTVLSVTMEDSLVQKQDRQMLEDLTAAAINHFQQKVSEGRNEKLKEVTGGLPLPPGMDFGL